MKWLPFTVLAVVALVCQTTIVQSMAIHSIWPDWMFVLAVHYALWGPWPDAAIAGWVLGLMVGVSSGDRIGLHAFAFGAAAWAIIHIRHVLFRDHAITQLVVTLVFAFAVQLLVGGYRWWGAGSGATSIWWPAFFTAVYTAAWAPYLHWPLLRLARWTGLRSAHGPYR
jgi:rod shape-determining protein MreD